MILGMSTHVFTLLHVVISLVTIVSGVVVIAGLTANRLHRLCNSLFLATASLTSITGFAFPNTQITPGIFVGALSLIALVLAASALHGFGLRGGFRKTFVVCTIVALYFNLFVLIAQLFRHVPWLTALDRTGSGPVFATVQLLLLILCTRVGITALRRFAAKASTIYAQIAANRAPMQW